MPTAESPLPRIIWVAAHPPVPPFSGATGKTLCGIQALAAATAVEVVSFAAPGSEDELAAAFVGYWGSRSVTCHWLRLGPRPGRMRALLSGRFQWGLQLEQSPLSLLLDKLDWSRPEHLLVFDDIALAPFLARFGGNAIISPHDCMSKMFHSHLSGSRSRAEAARYLVQSVLARRYERSFFHLALLTHVVTQRDRVWLETINPRARFEVVANADLLNPGLTATAPNGWDLLVWGDLGIGSIARGARAFLAAAGEQGWLGITRVRVVGRAAAADARRILGSGLFSQVTYAPQLEGGDGRIQHARIVVIPDIGGAGIKNRCVNALSSGKCLACLYPQMEGVEKACDQGAINAGDSADLARRVQRALAQGTWEATARKGQEIYRGAYGLESIFGQWRHMVARAVAIRDHGD
ncbi:MAG: hypothetical protein JXO51_02675 [Candidatus Aminicenantes bacterium]|nr:hypothetical protein [Candidatus Aminicenantes bacterium]